MNFDLENLETYEDDLILSLITGLKEDDNKLKDKVLIYLEDFGKRRKDLYETYKK